MYVNPYAVPYASPYMGAVPMVSNPTSLYFILLLGLMFFMWQSTLSGMMPGADKTEAWTPLVLQAAFAILMLTVCANMLGNIRGVSPLELTWVHLTAGILVFFIMWNYHLASQPKPAEKRSSSSSSSSSSAKPPEEPASKPKEKPKEPDPWDNELAHPSAFLTTSKVEPKPWPFPLGLADGKDKLKLWWESGLPAHVGHFNRPLTPKEKPQKSKDKDEPKESKSKPEDTNLAEPKVAKDPPSEPAKLTPEQELEERKKRKEVEAKKLKELEMAKIQAMTLAKRQYLQNESAKRLWRTRILCIIVGISLLNKGTAFFCLLAFAMNIISDYLNPTPVPPDPPKLGSGSTEKSSDKTEKLSDKSSSRPSGDPREARDRLRKEPTEVISAPADSSTRPKDAPPRENREVRSERSANPAEPSSSNAGPRDPRESSSKPSSAKPEAVQSSSSRDGREPSASLSSARATSSSSAREPSERSTSSKEAQAGSSRSASSTKSEVVTSDAIKTAAGSTTVTKPSETAVKQPRIGFGMHYIHVTDKGDLVDVSQIPSRGLAHPLMTTQDPGLAN